VEETANLVTRSWRGRVMGTEARLLVVTADPKAGDAALACAVRDLEATEQALSRFRADSELSRLNRSGTAIAGERLMATVREAVRAYEWSGGLLDPRVIESLERFGYGEALPDAVAGEVGLPEPLAPVEDINSWIVEPDRISLPQGVRLDLAGVGKALGIGWAAAHLAGHAGLLVDVGGDIVALGADAEGGPWRVSIVHGEDAVGLFAGSALAIATSTTERRSWLVAGQKAHHLIDPRTGAPVRSNIASATVAAPTILEADVTAKLLILEGKAALERLGSQYRAIVSNREGSTEVLI
jgi:FAD:protein FMN transferase